MTKLNRLMASKNNPRPRERRPLKAMPRVIEDKTKPFERPAERVAWDVVMLSPQANDGTMERIKAAGFDIWRPRTVILLTAASVGKAVFVNRPLWPRYAFLGRNAGCASPSDVPYVGTVRVVGYLPGSMVTSIADREERGEFDCRTLPPEPPTFKTGSRVQTLDGLMEGIVLRSEGERVVLLRQFLGADREIEVCAGKLKEMT